MDTEEIFQRVQETIVDQLAVEPEEVTLSASFFDDLNADPEYMLEFAEAVEDVFGIRIPDEELENLETVGDAVRAIQDRLEE
ncbi:MAG: acyl carrier protein [Coprothermobacterota bacterium]|jgi:acyl carrier protein|nr:acyl carrier protein [Coprothermobacterota bacterium]